MSGEWRGLDPGPKVVPLRDAPSLADIPGRLRQMADDIESGVLGARTALVAIENHEGGMGCFCFGNNPNRFEVVGLFQAAAIRAATRTFE